MVLFQRTLALNDYRRFGLQMATSWQSTSAYAHFSNALLHFLQDRSERLTPPRVALACLSGATRFWFCYILLIALGY